MEMRIDKQACNFKGKGKRKRKAGIVSAVVVGALIVSVALGGYAAFASGLAQSNYRWFTDDPSASVYTLTKPGDVYSFAEIVNGTAPQEIKDNYISDVSDDGTYSFEGKTVQIATGRNPSISDLPDESQTGTAGKLPLNTLGTRYEFEPIGTPEHPFQGTFEGNGATLLNMLNDNGTYGTENQGFFGVIGESGTARNFTVTGNITINTSERVQNVGGIAGVNKGTLDSVTSQVNITIDSDYEPKGEETDTTSALMNLGGVVGHSLNSIVNCNYNSALLNVKSDHDAAIVGYYADYLASNIGGVVGALGASDIDNTSISATKCSNDASIYICLTGEGGFDSWGTRIDAKSSDVGGVIGLSYGDIYDCANTGEVRSAAREAEGREGQKTSIYDATNDNGAGRIGGIVGSLASGSASHTVTLKGSYNTGLIVGSDHVGGIVGSASTYTLVTECSNGNALAANVNIMDDDDTMPLEQGGVISTRWNKPMTGGIAGTSSGTVSYCDNRGLVKNLQAGYYTAGIVSGLGYGDVNDTDELGVGYVAEVYGCWNSGQISPGHPTNQRFGALIGDNDGYVHDCVLREGSVAIGNNGESFAIGGAVEGKWDNLEVMSASEMKTANATTVLNADCFSGNEVTLYWFSGAGSAKGGANYNDGFPVLTTWATPENGIQLDPSRLDETSVKDAVYVDPEANSEPTPTVELSFMLSNGNIVNLRQNADYLIIPEEGAYERSDVPNEDGVIDNPQPYKYSIKGIGLYAGTILDFGNYGITAGTMDDMTVVVDPNRKFNWEVQFPEYVDLYNAAGEKQDNSDGSLYSYIIYDSGTNNIYSELAPKYPVFDSEGYIVFDDAPNVEVPALEAVTEVNRIVPESDKRSFKVYDRDKRLISDSDKNVYDEYGDIASGRMIRKVRTVAGGAAQTASVAIGLSCYTEKLGSTSEVWDHNGDAGYTVEIFGKNNYEGSVKEGHFLIQKASLEEDCEVTVKMPGEDGLTYTYDPELGFYREDPLLGSRIVNDATMKFNAESIKPTFNIKYLGRDVEMESKVYNNDLQTYVLNRDEGDYSVIYGGDEVVDAGTNATPDFMRNRNATTPNGSIYGAACTARYTSRSDFKTGHFSFSGYIKFDFDIKPVSSQDVIVNVQEAVGMSAFDDELYDKAAPVTLTFGGNLLYEDIDYTLEYLQSDGSPIEGRPTETGSYKVKVSLLEPNFVDQLDTQIYSIKVQDNQTFNVKSEFRDYESTGQTKEYLYDETTWYPGPMTPTIEFTDDDGSLLQLEFGKDYIYEINCGGIENERTIDGSNRLVPYAYGTSFSHTCFSSTTYKGSLDVRIFGLGKYASYKHEFRWKINQLDISNTPDSDWEYNLENPTIDLWGKSLGEPGTNVVDFDPDGWIKYQGYLVYVGGIYALTNSNLNTDPYYVRTGDEVQWVYRGDCYQGIKTLPGKWVVKPHDLSDELYLFKSELQDYTYDGGPKEPKITEVSGKIREGDNYSVSYSNNVDAGQATAMLTGVGNYSGRNFVFFNISQRSLSKNKEHIEISSIEDQTFTGEQLEPALTITDNGLSESADEERKHLVEGRDYTISYAANVEVGTALVTIEGIGNYTGVLQTTFNVVADENNVSYFVEYVDAVNTSRHIATTERHDGNKAGQTVTVTAPATIDVKGTIYRAVPVENPVTSKTITLSATEKNTVTFVYLRDGDKLPEDAEGIDVDIKVYDTNWYAAATATVYPEGANQTVTWTTSDTNIAQINSKGWVLASEDTDGVVDITATSESNPDISGNERLAVVGREGVSDEVSSDVTMEDVPSGAVFEASWKANPGVSVGDGEKIAAAYDIKLYAMEYLYDSNTKTYTSTGKPDRTLPIQPLKETSISIPIPQGYETSELAVYHWDEALATYEDEKVTVSDNGKYLQFATDHLSLFTIVQKGVQTPSTTNPDDNNSDNSKDPGTVTNPTTNSTTNPTTNPNDNNTTQAGPTGSNTNNNQTSSNTSGGSDFTSYIPGFQNFYIDETGSSDTSGGSNNWTTSDTPSSSGGGTTSPDEEDANEPLSETDEANATSNEDVENSANWIAKEDASLDSGEKTSNANEKEPDFTKIIALVIALLALAGIAFGAYWFYGKKACRRRH